MTSVEAAILRAVNATRVAHGAPPLRFDPTLERAARAHTSRMMRTGVFAHGNFAARMARFHVRGPAMGENLAWGGGPYGTPASIIATWMGSPAHRANLLRRGFRRIGIGAVVGAFAGESRATVVTADFAGR